MKLDMDLLIASGPSVEVQDKFLCTSDTGSIINLGFVSNLHDYIYASDLVVALAGRSTIDESIVYKTPGIFIPIKNHFEQEENARRMGYNYEDIFRLESLIEEKFDNMSVTTNDKNNAGALIEYSDEIAGETGEQRLRAVLRRTAELRRVVKKDQVDIARIVQLPAAEFSHPEDDQAAAALGIGGIGERQRTACARRRAAGGVPRRRSPPRQSG